jgi:hypothetical protein
MSVSPLRPLAAFAVLGAAAAMCASCSKTDSSQQPTAKRASAENPPAQTTKAATPDPCTLLSPAEAQAYVGTLITPPYRANSDGLADAGGDACLYRGSGARQLAIVRTGADSAQVGKILDEVPNAVGGALEKAGAGNLAAAAHQVMAQIPDAAWDKATWIPGGTLFVTKGAQGVNVDVSAASGKQDEAVTIARQIVPRLDHPLDYDGAKAAALAPKPKSHPSSACDVVPQAAVEGAIGTLSGSPVADPGGSKCSYQVAGAQGMRTYSIEFVWQGGLKNFNMLKNGMSTLGSVMGGSIPTAGMDSMKMDPNMSKLMGGLMNMAGGGSGAPGAATQVGFKTDTTLQGPWDSAMLMHGTQLLAVRNDVMVGMDLQSADYEKAKALMAVICSAI